MSVQRGSDALSQSRIDRFSTAATLSRFVIKVKQIYKKDKKNFLKIVNIKNFTRENILWGMLWDHGTI